MDTDTTDTSADAEANVDGLWDDSAAEYFGDRYQKDDESNDENKSTTTGTDGASTEGSEDDKGAKSEKAEGESDADDDSQADSEEVQADSTYREQRAIQREIEADRNQMFEDVRENLFSDFEPEIKDADGDVIRTPADVMKHINEETGKPFTAEEAVAWLHAMEGQKTQERANNEREVERVAEVNITLRDEIDEVRTKYAKIFKDFPDLRKEIWDDYKQTMKVDPKSGIIVDTPFSVKGYFERSMKPYAQYAEQLQTQASAKEQKAEAARKAAERRQNQADRSDVIPRGNSNVSDEEEDAWAATAKEYYEGK